MTWNAAARWTIAASALLVASAAAAQAGTPPAGDVDHFDLSGLQERPTSFVEQQLRDLVAHHAPGDHADAARIQRKLARYYREKGDVERARASERRASPETTPAPLAAPAQPATSSGSPPRASITGKFYAMVGRTLHTWDFLADGSCYHATAVAGAGTSVRSGERGRCELSGDTLVVHVQMATTGYATPGVGRGTTLGASSDARGEVRRIGFRRGSDGAFVLDGVVHRPRSW
jgi:hypothetical protein